MAGSAPMADLLDEVTADKMVDGRKVQVRRVKSSDSKLRECHILLVESGSPESFVEATHDSSVLTVGNGIGPATRAPVRFAVSTISVVD